MKKIPSATGIQNVDEEAFMANKQMGARILDRLSICWRALTGNSLTVITCTRGLVMQNL